MIFRLPAIAAYITLLAGAEAKVEFNRDIRPILSDKCFYCHGPDKNHRKSGLRLDVREDALKPAKSGDVAIVPGKPDESALVMRIFSADKDEMMPPEEAHKTLSAAQKEMLKRWIAEGAEYQQHWAYITPLRPKVPGIADWEKRDAARGAELRRQQARLETWARNPIDAFVLDRLLQQGLAPSPEAMPDALCRRLYLDLLGLPPTPGQVKAFAAESIRNPQSTIRDLLASPHFGERMAVPWLDAVRFADTVGFHGDQRINIFPYRDYVIDSFNKNKPFDQFTIEQLAGDLLPEPTQEQLIATGFNRLNMVTREGGAQPKEYLAKYGGDRVRTVASAWLGSSMACCECHDHKFDPFLARDFYSMSAFFADVKQWGVYNDYAYTPNPELKGWSNDHPFPPEIEVENAALKRRQDALGKRIAQLTDKLDAARQASFSTWRESARALLKSEPSGWLVLAPAGASQRAAAPKKSAKAKTVVAVKAEPVETPAAEFTIGDDRRIVFAPTPATKTNIEFQPPPGWLAAVRVELLPDEKHRGNILRGNAKSTILKPIFILQKADGKPPLNLAMRQADSNRSEPRYFNGFAQTGIASGWPIANTNEAAAAVWLLDTPVQVVPADTLTVQLDENVAGSLRVSFSPLAAPTPHADWTALAKVAQSDTPAARALWLASTDTDPALFAKFKALAQRIAECRDGRAMSLVTKAQEPLTIRVLARGNWQDESGEIVNPAPPRFLPPAVDSEAHRLTRLDLAKWLVAPENPLTARVFMNRLWKQFFGNALSAQVNDLGAQGEWPTHPELLDWLAVEFRESGWDVKHMVELIVTSAAYRQDSNLRPELREADPENRLLASQNPRRLEAEFVRDNALAIAGLLNLEIGGPSALPYQPAGYYENLQFPDRVYAADADERQYRRGLYTHWQRTFLHPMLANFDAPSREETACTRTVANTPQQALTLLDDPTFVEAARSFAAKLLAESANNDGERIAAAFARALARAPREKESRSLGAFLATQRDYFQTHPDDAQKLVRVGIAPAPSGDAPELAAWTSLSRVVLNLHETITRY